MAPTSEKRKLEDPNAQQSTPDTTDKRPRVIGPSLPPPQASNSNSDNSDSDSDDDDFGPTLPPPEGSVDTSAATRAAIAIANAKAEEEAQAAAKPQRDEWMLLPPENSDWGSRVDPTKLRNRKFQSGKGAASGGKSGGVDVSWTETPEEKLKRLQDSILGVAAPGEGRREAKRKDIAAEHEKERKAREEKKKEEDDDPSSRAFDREKDMALSSKITASQRREMINKAGDFGSRFTKGKFL
ncbi:hypothetical protein P168DRAFT_317464 [Aspergillus campestris IBT 28561]|uniref:DUF3752 domain-containing protein n=1 Tax=Aspergillus campestris (strain IBT 28561) TaxID=1392248 RepID=A0A2I1D7V1_ASPC2|nr:uncharacterized protein P168DRAFT_317464 [Aspergillus campestris IBT 28561]PKY05960.1 hypothetical protein P168DRAFT_317464 [Aspergillus campestris IBT 28561]